MRFPKPPQEIIEFQELHADECEKIQGLWIDFVTERDVEKKKEIKERHSIMASKYNAALVAAGLDPRYGYMMLPKVEPRLPEGSEE